MLKNIISLTTSKSKSRKLLLTSSSSFLYCNPPSKIQSFSSGYHPNATKHKGSFSNLNKNASVYTFGGITRRCYSSSNSSGRESIEYDVVIVGGGPAGLSAAIRLKQLCLEHDVDFSVCVVEKGAELGAHILSGNVFEPRALNELIPHWKDEEAPISVGVSSDKFMLLTKKYAIPMPNPFDNEGNYVISVSQFASWLGQKAEELGVELYPRFAAKEILFDESENVIGIATNDMGIGKDGSKKDNYTPGVELKGCGLDYLWSVDMYNVKSDKKSRMHIVAKTPKVRYMERILPAETCNFGYPYNQKFRWDPTHKPSYPGPFKILVRRVANGKTFPLSVERHNTIDEVNAKNPLLKSKAAL